MRSFFIQVCLLVACTSVFAQSNVRAWKPIDEKDILWKKRVWRIVNIAERSNAQFRMDSLSSDEGIFPNMVSAGIKGQVFKAYADSNLSLALTMQAFDSLIASSVAGLRYPQQIKGYEIVEDWIFDRNEGRMIVRIVALAPLAAVDSPYQQLFWLSYPDARWHFSKFHIHNPNKDQRELTWEDYFEKRMFSSKIIKTQDLYRAGDVEVIEKNAPDTDTGKRRRKER